MPVKNNDDQPRFLKRLSFLLLYLLKSIICFWKSFISLFLQLFSGTSQTNLSIVKLQCLRYKVSEKKCTSATFQQFRAKLTTNYGGWDATTQLWRSNYKNENFISLIIEFIHKHVILSIDIKVQEGSMNVLMFSSCSFGQIF